MPQRPQVFFDLRIPRRDLRAAGVWAFKEEFGDQYRIGDPVLCKVIMVHMFTKDEGVTRCVAMVQYESTNPASPPPSVEFICLYNALRESRGQSPAERLCVGQVQENGFC